MIESKFPFRGQGYDFIFTGAGCAALSLLIRMIKSGGFADKKILLIDKAPKTKNDRTWCFWEKENGFFEEIVFRKWSKLSFFSDDYSATLDISPYEYKMIRGIDFYNYCFSEIAKHDNIDIVFGAIRSAKYHKEGFTIYLDDQTIDLGHATVFNSFFSYNEQEKVKLNNELTLLQHFKGWVIETSGNPFDPGKATFMDFRVQQQRGTTFAYVLPFSENKALVEYTLFSKDLLESSEYESGLRTYIREFLKIENYRILEEEFGVIPMTTKKFNFYDNSVYHIGTIGGQTKASSGYTFQFIQKQADLIIGYLQHPNKALFEIPPTPSRFLFYDKVLLDVIYHKRASGKEIFTTLFKKNKPQQVLKFLDNESSLTEELKIISTLPALPFLKAAIRQL